MNRTPIPLRSAPRVLLVGASCALLLGAAAGCRTTPTPASSAVSDQVASAQVASAQVATDRPAGARGADVHAGTVRLLASPDFETRARASRTLVRAGEAALPALGRAGDVPVRVAGGVQVSATRAVVRAILREGEDDRLVEHLGSPWANVRRESATEIGQRGRWSAVPRLIDRLEDQDAEVRAASAAALRRVTNNFFGYRAEAAAAPRRAGADRWREWWSFEGRARTHEGGPGREVAQGR